MLSGMLADQRTKTDHPFYSINLLDLIAHVLFVLCGQIAVFHQNDMHITHIKFFGKLIIGDCTRDRLWKRRINVIVNLVVGITVSCRRDQHNKQCQCYPVILHNYLRQTVQIWQE